MPVLTVGDDSEFPGFYSRHSGVLSPLHVTNELAAVKVIGHFAHSFAELN